MVEIPKMASASNNKNTKFSKPKPKVKQFHPPTSKMVQMAILSLQDRRGSSVQAIKKYIMINYNLDSEKTAPLVKRYIKFAIPKGKLIQTKGKGASGSFKLPSANQAVQIETSKTSLKKKNSTKQFEVNSIGINRSVAPSKSNHSLKKSVTKVSKLLNEQKIEKINKKERKTYNSNKNSLKDSKNGGIYSNALKALTSQRILRSNSK